MPGVAAWWIADFASPRVLSSPAHKTYSSFQGHVDGAELSGVHVTDNHAHFCCAGDQLALRGHTDTLFHEACVGFRLEVEPGRAAVSLENRALVVAQGQQNIQGRR